jgi:uncharacterized membrane protein
MKKMGGIFTVGYFHDKVWETMSLASDKADASSGASAFLFCTFFAIANGKEVKM